MEAVLSRLRELSADELREEFARADLKCGPITATTRAIFERKLARVLAGPESESSESGASASISASTAFTADYDKPVLCAIAAVATPTAATCCSSKEAASEELDFGYGLGLNPPEEDEISASSSAHNHQSKMETPSKAAQVSPAFYYGVCPPWEDVLSRNGK